MLKLAKNAKIWLIEFGSKALSSEYEKLLKVFLQQGFMAQDRGSSFATTDIAEARNYFLNSRTPSSDIYFVRYDLYGAR